MVQSESTGNTLAQLDILRREERSECLTQLLSRLEKEDSWFSYNVPAHLRRVYDDSQLLNYLQVTYSQPRFVIDDPKEVEKYIALQERVILKAVKTECHWKLNPGTIGKIVKATLGKNPIIRFTKGESFEFNPYYEENDLFNVEPKNLLVFGKHHFFWKDETFSIPLEGRDFQKFEKGHMVKYIGEPRTDFKLHIPAGAEGTVDAVYSDLKLYGVDVTWSYARGLICKGSIRHKVKELVLFRPNFIDFQKLYGETHGDFHPKSSNTLAL